MPPFFILRPLSQIKIILDLDKIEIYLFVRDLNDQFKLSGAIAQLGERLHRTQEVSGSIPLSSTNSSYFFKTYFVIAV